MENNESKRTPSRTPHEFKVMRVRECAFPAQMVDTPERAVEYWKQNIINADWYDESKEALVVLVLQHPAKDYRAQSGHAGQSGLLLRSTPRGLQAGYCSRRECNHSDAQPSLEG
jgi:hypothetical protein